MQCPLCKSTDCNRSASVDRNSAFYECKNCGDFTLTAQASSAIGTDAWKLAAFVREKTLQGLDVYLWESQKQIPHDARKGCVGLDQVIETFPKLVSDRFDRVLLNLDRLTKYLGERVMTRGDIYPVFFARNTTETLFTLRGLSAEGYVTGELSTIPGSVSLTAKGLMRAADLKHGLFGPLNKQVFVAMSFAASLGNAYAEGLKLGIEDCGYTAMRVDEKEHNKLIDDVIVAEIRRSKFLVADFTEHKNGVYFESGLMMGLGRPVIFTCRDDHFKNAHFDTSHYSHIKWTTPGDLREKLKRRIQATIIE
jgi:hypothetical protein